MSEKLEQGLLKRRKMFNDIFLRSKDALVQKLNTFKTREERLDFLTNEVSRDILAKIENYRADLKNYSCAHCGTCCKMACGEFTHDVLLERAENGDRFAKSFLEVFVPYKDLTEVEQEFGEYISVLKKGNLFDGCNFFYCPKVKKDNGEGERWLCGDYENRPMVCRDFPNNPLVMLPDKCAYNAWKDKYEVEALFLKAMIELVGYFMDNI